LYVQLTKKAIGQLQKKGGTLLNLLQAVILMGMSLWGLWIVEDRWKESLTKTVIMGNSLFFGCWVTQWWYQQSLYSMLVGTMAGMVIGGGWSGTSFHLRTQGMMSGLMAGMMGAMLGVMTPFPQLVHALTFLFLLALFLQWRIVYQQFSERRTERKVQFLYVLFLLLIGFLFFELWEIAQGELMEQHKH
jgi:hypothetical protein